MKDIAAFLLISSYVMAAGGMMIGAYERLRKGEDCPVWLSCFTAAAAGICWPISFGCAVADLSDPMRKKS